MADNRHVGRVVKITRFQLPDRGLDNQLGKGEVVWAIVSHWKYPLKDGELNVDLLVYPDAIAQVVKQGHGTDNWKLCPNDDEWEFVRPNKVPGEVWAELAKRKLSQ